MDAPQHYHRRTQHTYKVPPQPGRRIHNMDELVELWFYLVRRIERSIGRHHPEIAELFGKALPIYMDAEVVWLVWEMPGDMFRIAEAMQTTALYTKVTGCFDGVRDLKLVAGNWTYRRVDDCP